MKRKIRVLFLVLMLISLISCKKENDNLCQCTTIHTAVGTTDPLFNNSVVATDIDFIREEDPDAFKSLVFVKQGRKEMPDSRYDVLFDEETYVFKASFEGGKEVEIWCHSSFGSEAKAKEYANKACPRLGKLPALHRDMLSHIVIHSGDATAFAEKGFFVLYADNMDTRISNKDLEETVFHESVHASIQVEYEKTSEWKLSQVADGNFMTDYALSRPSLEDMPETALFAYTMIKYPGRLSSDIERWVEDYIPNRLAFFQKIYK